MLASTALAISGAGRERSTMPEDRSPVKHISAGDDWYALIVLPQGDHWVAIVTLTDMSAAADSHFGRMIFGPRPVDTEEEGVAGGRGVPGNVQRIAGQAA